MRTKAKLIGENGNIFNLLAIARSALIKSGEREGAKKMCEEVFACKSYEEALLTIQKYVEIE